MEAPSTPMAKAGKPQQQAIAGNSPLFPSGLPETQTNARAVFLWVPLSRTRIMKKVAENSLLLMDSNV